VIRVIGDLLFDQTASDDDLLNDREAWAVLRAFYDSTIQVLFLLDTRVRLCLEGDIRNVHLLAVPLRESRTGLPIDNLVDALILEL
jgi:hypothetical protein